MANTRVLDESGGKAIAEQVKRVKGTAEEASSSASSAKLVAEQAKQGADDAKASVLEASAKAQTAKETAEAAAATAGEAKTTAEAAQDAADAAQSTADTAKANAATAQSAAEAAQTTADGASEAAKTAQSAAEAAQTVAEGAQDAADAAQNTADTAQQTAEAAQAAASQASAAVEKAQTAATAAQGAADTAQSAADAAQSAVEKANAAIDEVKQTAADAKKAAESAQSTADTAKANAATAQSAAEDAQSTADTAKTNAATAQSAAEAAQETANTAQQKAEAAQSAAEGAQETADAAQTTASGAQSTADTAKANAATAQSAAEAAQSAADKAQSAAEEAQTTADTAKTNAATAQSTADTAKANAATAQSTADTAKANAATAQSAAEAAQKTATDTKTAEEKHESNEDVHITAEEREKWNAAYEETILEYGVRFPLNASSPAGERVKRQGGEIQAWDIEYTPNVGSVTDNPFESIKLFNPELFTDSAGNVFRSFSRFYVAIERTSEYLYYWVCEKQANDKYHLPRAFYKNGSPYWNHVDIGVYEGGQETQSGATCLNSKSGQTLWTNQTRTAAYEGAKAWHKHLSVDTSRECYMITQLSEITEILQPLLLIMFGTRHSQSVYNGVVSASNYVQTGQTDSISALCGTTSNGGTASFKALGIENIWGNVFKRVLDLTMKAKTPWICENLDEWTDVDPATNSAFKEVSLELPASGWITDIGQATDHPDVVLPTAASGGSSSTYYPDYVYTSTSGPYTAYFGGDSNHGGNAGLFYWYLYGSLTYVNSNIGARLSHRRL